MTFHYLARFKLSTNYQIIKTFVVSQFVLPASLLVVPPEITKKIESILYEFLWGPRDKVKRVKVTQELKLGGLNMVDIKCLFMSFKAVWITRLLKSDPNIHNWAQIAHLYINSGKSGSLFFVFSGKLRDGFLSNFATLFSILLSGL